VKPVEVVRRQDQLSMLFFQEHIERNALSVPPAFALLDKEVDLDVFQKGKSLGDGFVFLHWRH
jgi:hypothetical protein